MRYVQYFVDMFDSTLLWATVGCAHGQTERRRIACPKGCVPQLRDKKIYPGWGEDAILSTHCKVDSEFSRVGLTWVLLLEMCDAWAQTMSGRGLKVAMFAIRLLCPSLCVLVLKVTITMT